MENLMENPDSNSIQTQLQTQTYMEHPLEYVRNIISKNIEEHIKLRLGYFIRINFPQYKIIQEYLIEEGGFVMISNDIDKKIIGIVPTKTKSIYGKQFYIKNTPTYTYDETFIIKDFTNEHHHPTHNHFNPQKNPTDKPHIICDPQGGIIVYDHERAKSSGFYNDVIPEEKRTVDNLLDNYYIIYQSFYDCARYTQNDEYYSLTNEPAVLSFLIN